MSNQQNPIKSGLERAMIDYDIFRNASGSGHLRQRATEIDSHFLEHPSRLFLVARRVGDGWYAYVDERYHPHKARQQM